LQTGKVRGTKGQPEVVEGGNQLHTPKTLGRTTAPPRTPTPPDPLLDLIGKGLRVGVHKKLDERKKES